MKFLHLGDLHLGIKFHKRSLIEDQAYVLNQIVDIVEEEQCMVIIAGDVYDTTNPSIEAQTLWFDFLSRISNVHKGKALCTWVISGNHDSPGRLNLGSQFTELGNVHIVTNPICIPYCSGFLFMPFIKPQLVDALYGTEFGDDYTEAFKYMLDRVCAHHGFVKENTIVVAHQTFEGGLIGESEFKPFMPDAIASDVCNDFKAIWAGHLHAKQDIYSSNGKCIHYSGSLLPYAFGDDYTPSVSIWDLNGDRPVLKERPIKLLHELRTIEGDLSHALSITADNEYVCVKLKNCVHLDEALSRLQEHFPYLLHVTTDMADKWIADLSKPIGTFKDFTEAINEFCNFLEIPIFSGKKQELIEEAVDAFNKTEN